MRQFRALQFCILGSLLVSSAPVIGAELSSINRVNQKVLRYGDWTPTIEEQKQTLQDIERSLNAEMRKNPTRDLATSQSIHLILDNPRPASVRFVAVTVAGKHYLHCYFTPTALETDNLSAKQIIYVSDIPYVSWKIDYAIESRRCGGFAITQVN